MGTSRKMGMLEARVQRVVRERVRIVFYDPEWPELFVKEKAHLICCLPSNAIGKIEHFGSTAVPGLAAKPIIDMLVEVPNLEDTRPGGGSFPFLSPWAMTISGGQRGETTLPPFMPGSSNAIRKGTGPTIFT